MRRTRHRLAVAVGTAALLGTFWTTGTPLAHAAGGARCAGKVATIVGTNGPDQIRGTNGRDVIQARGGDDQITGLGGDDLICGKGGNDQIMAGLRHR